MDRLFINSMKFQLNCPINNKQFTFWKMNCQRIIWNPKKCKSRYRNFRDKCKIFNYNFWKRNNFKVFLFSWTMKEMILTMKERNSKIQLSIFKTIWQIKKENSQKATHKRKLWKINCKSWNKIWKKRKMKLRTFKNNMMKVNKRRRKKKKTIMYCKINWSKAKKTLNILN